MLKRRRGSPDYLLYLYSHETTMRTYTYLPVQAVLQAIFSSNLVSITLYLDNFPLHSQSIARNMIIVILKVPGTLHNSSNWLLLQFTT
jgi:hypothetical protein